MTLLAQALPSAFSQAVAEVARRLVPAEAGLHSLWAPQPGPQTVFHTSAADLAIMGGAAFGGKSWALLLEPLKHVTNPQFTAVIFRRTSPQIRNEGGLWDESTELYPLAGGRPRESLLEWRFPSGATVRFAHMEYAHNRFDWSGAQVPFIGFDELFTFEEKMFWFMLSRNRSGCGVRPYIRATTNPDPDSWVADLLAWWLDPETGYPVPERAGVLRWFVRQHDALVWFDSYAEAKAAAAPEVEPKSFTFIPAKISDNPIGMQRDPGYLANLQALPYVERMQLLGGNWKIRPAAGKVFNRAWFDLVPAGPV